MLNDIYIKTFLQLFYIFKDAVLQNIAICYSVVDDEIKNSKLLKLFL